MGNPPKFTPTRNQDVLFFGSKIFADALSEDEVLVDGGGPQPQDWHPSRREQDPQRHRQGEKAAHGGRAEMGGRGLPAKAQPPDAVRGLDRVSLRGRRRNPPTCSHLILDPGPLQNREKINFCCFKPPRVWHFVAAPPGDPYMAARC